MVSPFQQGLERRSRQSAEPGGIEDGLSLEGYILTPLGLTDIIENYAQIVERKDTKAGKVKRDQLLPRFH